MCTDSFAKVGTVEVNKDGKVDVNLAKGEAGAGANSVTKTVGDNKIAETASANPNNFDLSLGVKAGLIGAEVSLSPGKILDAAENLFGTLFNYTKEVIKESLPDTRGGYIETHKKL